MTPWLPALGNCQQTISSTISSAALETQLMMSFTLAIVDVQASVESSGQTFHHGGKAVHFLVIPGASLPRAFARAATVAGSPPATATRRRVR